MFFYHPVFEEPQSSPKQTVRLLNVVALWATMFTSLHFSAREMPSEDKEIKSIPSDSSHSDTSHVGCDHRSNHDPSLIEQRKTHHYREMDLKHSLAQQQADAPSEDYLTATSWTTNPSSEHTASSSRAPHSLAVSHYAHEFHGLIPSGSPNNATPWSQTQAATSVAETTRSEFVACYYSNPEFSSPHAALPPSHFERPPNHYSHPSTLYNDVQRNRTLVQESAYGFPVANPGVPALPFSTCPNTWNGSRDNHDDGGSSSRADVARHAEVPCSNNINNELEGLYSNEPNIGCVVSRVEPVNAPSYYVVTRTNNWIDILDMLFNDVPNDVENAKTLPVSTAPPAMAPAHSEASRQIGDANQESSRDKLDVCPSDPAVTGFDFATPAVAPVDSEVPHQIGDASQESSVDKLDVCPPDAALTKFGFATPAMAAVHSEAPHQIGDANQESSVDKLNFCPPDPVVTEFDFDDIFLRGTGREGCLCPEMMVNTGAEGWDSSILDELLK